MKYVQGPPERKDIEENIVAAKVCLADLDKPEKILHNLIITLDEFLPNVGPGTPYDKAVKKLHYKWELASKAAHRNESIAKKILIKLGILEKEIVDFNNENIDFQHELVKIFSSDNHPFNIQDDLDNWYLMAFGHAHPLNISPGLLKELKLDENYCRNFYGPQLCPSIEIAKYEYEFPADDINSLNKNINKYRKELESGKYIQDLSDYLKKAEHLFNLWLKTF